MAEKKFIYYPIGAIMTDKPQIYVGGCYDGSEVFEHTYALLLAACPNAIIWVKADQASSDDEEFEVLMGRMNLVVLTISNEAMQDALFKREVKYSFEHDMPILPLIQKGVDRFGFEEVFGNRQYLDESNDDSTALPFKEKLKNFLDGVLLSDSTREAIKKVFHANIFLSYRKKDRAQANRIMKAIHEHEELRDVAIWYDEFLIPGEDYNEEIQTFLKESDIFVLAVTPSILEEGNYVMMHEFPDAKTLGKTIVPLEAEPVDEATLKDKFTDIPGRINLNDSETIAHTLIDDLASKSKSDAPDKDHIRNYFLGIAYLMGVGVEKNSQYAVEYLEKSAKGGLKLAYDKLISMYEKGEGINKSISKAMEWDVHFVHIARNQEKPNPKLLVEGLIKYARLTIAYYDATNRPLIHSGGAATTEEEKKKEEEIERKNREEKDKILGCAKKALDESKGLLDDSSIYDVYFYLEKTAEYYELYNMLHDRHFSESEEEVLKNAWDAIEHERKCLRLSEKYPELGEPTIVAMKERLGNSLMRFGDVLMAKLYMEMAMKKEISDEARKREDAARQRYIEASEIFVELIKKDDSVKIKRQLVKAYDFAINDIFRNPEKFENPQEDARLFADESISLMKTIYMQTGSPEDGRELATAYFQRGRVDKYMGDSVHYLEKAIELQEKVWGEVRKNFNALSKRYSDYLTYQLELMHYRTILAKVTEGQDGENE